MKKLLLYLFTAVALLGADAANDVVLSQRKADNSGFIQRNVPFQNAITSASLPSWLSGQGLGVEDTPNFTGVSLGVATPGSITGLAGALSFAAAGTNQNIDIAPSGTGSINLNATSGGVRLPNTNTSGLQLYNTADQVTNYRRLETFFSGTNSAVIGISTLGAGTSVPLRLAVQNQGGGATFTRLDVQRDIAPLLLQGIYTTQTGTTLSSTGLTGTMVSFGNGIFSATSGTVVSVGITPTYNQASGTAANTDLQILRTETAVGSGAQFLIQAGTAALGNQFTVGSRGAIASSVQALSGAGAVNITQAHTDYVSTGGAQALTLADGTAGQTKTICHVTDGGSGVLTPTTKTGFTTITFTNAGDSVTLRFSATGGWYIVGIFGAVAA